MDDYVFDQSRAPDTSANVLTIQTIQITPFKILLTALKDILIDTNITFRPEGMRIINTDKSHTILVNLFLPSENFEFYECKKDKIIVGVNILHLFKLVASLDNSDTLTIYIENGDYDDGIISHLVLKYENADINQRRTSRLRLIEPDHEELLYPDVVFSSIINLPSSDFQKIIRDLTGISDRVEIKSVGDELIFKCVGPFAEVKVNRAESDGSMEVITEKNASRVVQGEFSLKNLGYFIKCTNLCTQIEMYLENDLPLVIKYDVASLGEIKLCLAPLPSI